MSQHDHARGTSSALVARELPDPHALLGAHPDDGGVVVRACRPGRRARRAASRRRGRRPVELRARAPRRAVRGRSVDGARLPLRYELEVAYPDGAGRHACATPTRFAPTIGELDLHLAGEGRHEELYEQLGAHVREVDGVDGHRRSPSGRRRARSVSVVGDFNSWDGRLHPMRSLGSIGHLGALPARRRRRARATSSRSARQVGRAALKADPYAFAAEVPPKTASVVDRSRHAWGDDAWLARARRAATRTTGPMSIYEVHLGSWRRDPDDPERAADLRRARRRAGGLLPATWASPTSSCCR